MSRRVNKGKPTNDTDTTDGQYKLPMANALLHGPRDFFHGSESRSSTGLSSLLLEAAGGASPKDVATWEAIGNKYYKDLKTRSDFPGWQKGLLNLIKALGIEDVLKTGAVEGKKVKKVERKDSRQLHSQRRGLNSPSGGRSNLPPGGGGSNMPPGGGRFNLPPASTQSSASGAASSSSGVGRHGASTGVRSVKKERNVVQDYGMYTPEKWKSFEDLVSERNRVVRVVKC